MEACLSIKFAYLDWLTCKKCLLGGHGKARRTVNKGKKILSRFKLSSWPLQKLLYFICILFLFYCYYTYFNFVEIYFIAIFFDKENRPSILLLFCFYWNPILQAVVYFIPVLFYQTTK